MYYLLLLQAFWIVTLQMSASCKARLWQQLLWNKKLQRSENQRTKEDNCSIEKHKVEVLDWSSKKNPVLRRERVSEVGTWWWRHIKCHPVWVGVVFLFWFEQLTMWMLTLGWGGWCWRTLMYLCVVVILVLVGWCASDWGRPWLDEGGGTSTDWL